MRHPHGLLQGHRLDVKRVFGTAPTSKIADEHVGFEGLRGCPVREELQEVNWNLVQLRRHLLLYLLQKGVDVAELGGVEPDGARAPFDLDPQKLLRR